LGPAGLLGYFVKLQSRNVAVLNVISLKIKFVINSKQSKLELLFNTIILTEMMV